MMSKDKGSKNHKKAPADKNTGKGKVLSAYKSEGKTNLSTIDAFTPKTDAKTGKSKKD